MFWATRDDEPNGYIGIHCDFANQCEDIPLRIEVFAFVQSVNDDDGRARSDWEESDWFNDESFQLYSRGLLGEGKVLYHGPINMLEHTMYVRCELVGESGK